MFIMVTIHLFHAQNNYVDLSVHDLYLHFSMKYCVIEV